MTESDATLEQAGRGVWDVIIVGAGPAGALAARQLAKLGLRTMLLDRRSWPRTKVCGACLNLVALDVLKSAGMEDVVSGHQGITLKALKLSMAGRTAEFSLPGGKAISRACLDAALVDAAARAGAVFLPRTRGLVGATEEEARRVDLIQPCRKVTARARVVLVATGLGQTYFEDESVVRSDPVRGSRIGAGCIIHHFPDCYEEGIVYMAVGRTGYLGMVRIEDGKLNVAAAFDVNYVKDCGDLGTAAERILACSTFPPAPALRHARWQGTPLLTRRTRPIAGERFFLIGDATGYVEPFTGEGMAWALLTGRAVAPLAEQGVDRWNPALPRVWTSLHHRLLANKQSFCRGVSMLLRHPGLARTALGVASRVPRLAQALIQHVNTYHQHTHMS
ncbi:MAG: NAD(P)/FAD-dependent oxidoreductase [Isosphaeraceae bacterium]